MTEPSSHRRIAVVGAGPAGLYAVQAALAIPEVGGVDVYDVLPAPYGLVRYGVAADHAKTKSVVRVFQRELERDEVRFFGNVGFGVDVHRADLRRHYDAVIYSTGARHDRDLGVPGEHLAGSHGAAQFVSWYSGHPDGEPNDLLAGATGAVVVGAGNVALDVLRILAKDAGELAETDMPDPVLELLAGSTITDLHLLSRRGPAQAKFTSAELRELGDLTNADVLLDPSDLELDAAGEEAAAASSAVRRNLAIMAGWADNQPTGRPRRIHLHFWTRPLQLLGVTHVSGVEIEKRSPGSHSPEVSVLDAQLVLRAIGYQAHPLPEVPFDADRAVVPNDAGRVIEPAGDRAGEYVAGWLKRGPTGLIGTNRNDAAETVRQLEADLPTLPPRPVTDPDAIIELLHDRGVRFVDWAGWQRLERHEAALGALRNTTTVKVADWKAMLDIAHSLAEAD